MLGYFALLFLYLGLLLHGTFEAELGGRVGLRPWNLALVPALLLGFLNIVHAGKLRVTKQAKLAILAFLLFLLISLFGMLANGASGSAYVTLAVYFALLFVWLGSLSSAWDKSSESLARWGVALCLATAVAGLPAYLDAVVSIPEIKANPSYWDPGVGYMLDRGRFLRFVGLAENPNFFGLYAMPALFYCLFFLKSRAGRLLGGALLVFLLMTISLGLTLGFIAASGLFVMRRRMAGGRSRNGILLSGIAGAVCIWLALTLTPLADLVGDRLQTTGAEGRVDLVESSVAAVGVSLTGGGLRSIDTQTGKFSHNTYVDLLLETGILGFSCYLLMLLIVGRQAFRLCIDHVAGPWALTFFVFLLHATAHSLSYSPILFIAMAVILGRDWYLQRLRAADSASEYRGSNPA